MGRWVIWDKNPSDTGRGVCVCVCARTQMFISPFGIFLINKVLCWFYASARVYVDHLCACLFPLDVERMVFILSVSPGMSAELWLAYQVLWRSFFYDFLQPSLNFLWNSSCIEISSQIINILVPNMKASAEPLSCERRSLLLGNPEGSFAQLALFVSLFRQCMPRTSHELGGWANFATSYLHDTYWLLDFNILMCTVGVWIR